MVQSLSLSWDQAEQYCIECQGKFCCQKSQIAKQPQENQEIEYPGIFDRFVGIIGAIAVPVAPLHTSTYRLCKEELSEIFKNYQAEHILG